MKIATSRKDGPSASTRRVFFVYRYINENHDIVNIVRSFFEGKARHISGVRWHVDVLDPMLPSGVDILQGLVQAIKASDLVVIVASDVNNNVAFELGLTHALGKDLILLVPQPRISEIKKTFSDISGLKYCAYDPQAITRIPDLLRRELSLLEERKRIKVTDMLTSEYLMSFGDQLRLHGLPTKAMEQYKAALAADPKNATCLIRMGQLHLEGYRLTDAEAVLRRALMLDSRNTLAFEVLGQVLLDGGQYDRAVSECFERLIALNPDDEVNYFKITIALNELGKPHRAVEYLTDAIETRGIKSAGLLYDRAWSAIRRARQVKSSERERWVRSGLKSLRAAAELEPTFLDRARIDQDFDDVRERADFPSD